MKSNKCSLNGLKYPAADKIGSRTSTICRSMACTLLNRNGCNPDEEKKWMKYFPEKKCAYCGKRASHLDHLFALISDRKPTGYCTEPANLVPCCKDCNQPKGNQDWEEFMRSSKCKHSFDPVNENVNIVIENRIRNIKEFQAAMPATRVEISDELLARWDAILIEFDESLKNAQTKLEDLKNELYK